MNAIEVEGEAAVLAALLIVEIIKLFHIICGVWSWYSMGVFGNILPHELAFLVEVIPTYNNHILYRSGVEILMMCFMFS